MQGESVTNMKKGITQAYKLVPWRGQMQWLGVITLALVTISLIAWVYLSVSSKASIAGRGIQQYQYEKSKTIQSIAQLETDLARITSSTEMASRAKKLGFKELSADRYTYMVIPGYNGKPSAILAPDSIRTLPEDVISPEFTQSLWDWMYDRFVQPVYDN
jgi:hypothetical protein